MILLPEQQCAGYPECVSVLLPASFGSRCAVEALSAAAFDTERARCPRRAAAKEEGKEAVS